MTDTTSLVCGKLRVPHFSSSYLGDTNGDGINGFIVWRDVCE